MTKDLNMFQFAAQVETKDFPDSAYTGREEPCSGNKLLSLKKFSEVLQICNNVILGPVLRMTMDQNC